MLMVLVFASACVVLEDCIVLASPPAAVPLSQPKLAIHEDPVVAVVGSPHLSFERQTPADLQPLVDAKERTALLVGGV
jgi:hypothetical protein